jgi:hypothetical protein
MAFHATITASGFNFASPAAAMKYHDWKKAHVGERVVIDLDKPPVSDEMRGYMFGAVIPFLKRIVPNWHPLSDDQVYEILKKNFNYFEAWNPLTKRKERYGQSIMSRSCKNEEAMQFIQEVAGWVAENYAMQLPDPERFKAWRDSAPAAGEKFNDN